MNIRRLQEQLGEMQRKYAALQLADKDQVVATAAHVHAKTVDLEARSTAAHANIRAMFRAEKSEWLRFMEEARVAITELRTIVQELAVAAKLPRISRWQRICAWFK